MKLSKFFIAIAAVIGLSGCIWWPDELVTNTNAFEVNEGISNSQMNDVTVKQLYDAFLKTVKDNPKDFDLTANDYDYSRAEVYAFSHKYNVQVQFYALNVQGRVIMGIKLGDDESVKSEYINQDAVSQLKAIVEKNLRESSSQRSNIN